MLNFWNSLSTLWKVVLIIAVIIFGIIVYDSLTGGISDLRSWVFDKQSSSLEKKNDELSKQVEQLRAEKADLEKQAIEAKAKEAVFEEREKALDSKTKDELNKLDQALAEQDREEAITAQPIDSYTRCTRTKEKLLAQNIKSAGEINCEEFK